MDTDILKPDTGALSIERPLHTSSKGSSDRHSSGISTPKDAKMPYHEPVSEGEEDDDMGLVPGGFHGSNSCFGRDLCLIASWVCESCSET